MQSSQRDLGARTRVCYWKYAALSTSTNAVAVWVEPPFEILAMPLQDVSLNGPSDIMLLVMYTTLSTF